MVEGIKILLVGFSSQQLGEGTETFLGQNCLYENFKNLYDFYQFLLYDSYQSEIIDPQDLP